jgi:hypothetical protein
LSDDVIEAEKERVSDDVIEAEKERDEVHVGMNKICKVTNNTLTIKGIENNP